MQYKIPEHEQNVVTYIKFSCFAEINEQNNIELPYFK